MKYTDSRSGTAITVSHAYDSKNNLTGQTQSFTASGVAKNRTAVYGYDGDNRLTDYSFGNSDLTYSYDAYNRLRVTTLNYNDSQILQKNVTYQILNNTVGTNYINQHQVTAANYGLDLHYNYDDNGNILSVSDGTYTTTYEYDQANQLIRENNQAAGYTRVWAYDNSGNIENRRTFAYTTGEVDLFAYNDFVDYQYTNSNWGDLLTHYGDKVFSYDAIGNLLSDGSRTYTWKHGRQLATLSDGTTTWTYTYNSDGLRTKRTNGTNTYSYTYANGQLSYMIANGTDVFIAYDGLGQPLSINCNGATYFYVTNLQGDVVALLNGSGTAVVEYTYDAWGNILSCTGSMASTLGALNPLRYRGYVYDQETGLYYLQSRYYDPEVGRFINADGLISTGQGFIGNNMFAYCLNNAVNFVDYDGEDPEAILASWAGGMGWLPFADTALPIGDLVYVSGILLLGTVALISDQDYVPEISYDEADVAYGPPSPNDDDDDDDYDDYYDDDSNFGGRQKVGKPKGNAPGNNRVQNKQFKDATKDWLNKDQQRFLHDEISGEGLGYHDIVNIAKDLWFFLIGLFDKDNE